MLVAVTIFYFYTFKVHRYASSEALIFTMGLYIIMADTDTFNYIQYRIWFILSFVNISCSFHLY